MLGALFSALAPFDPTLVGTFPLGLRTTTSDIDVACHALDLGAFEARLDRFLAEAGIAPQRRTRAPFVPEASVTGFVVGGVEVEVFAQAVPVHAQNGFRHMAVEARLLAIGGGELCRRVRAAKEAGMKTEPAFAWVLGLVTDDPYRALLDLETASHPELVAIVARAAGPS